MTDILRIAWRSPGAGGEERTVAFFVRQLEAWVAELG
jgi:hypothetical protein